MTPSRKGVRVEQNTDEPTDVAAPQPPWDDGEEPVIDDAPSVNPTGHFQAARKPKGVVTTGDTPAPPPSSDDPILPPGTVLGEYQIEAPIGEGGMGVVYSAVHPLIGKRAAVKVLKAELCRARYNVERFVDEARVVNRIGHPNIVDVFAFGQTADGRSYFVMEWLKGESLRARVAREQLDLSDVCEIIRPLARALEAAHEQGVIHRDLKPDNIFLVDVRGEAPLVKLLDFGIAKLSREEHRMERTATGAMVGTPQYIAPEQAKGYAIDHRVDIYALGGILFELLTGRPPFMADNAMEMVAKHLMEQPPRPSALAPHVPAELDDLVLRMLAKDPAARPTLAEVATVIEHTTSLDRTIVKRTPTPLPQTPPPSGPINIPTPTPLSSPNLRGLRGSSPRVQPVTPRPVSPAAMSASMPASVPVSDLSLKKPGIGAKAIVLLGAAVLAVAAVAYVVVSKLGSDKPTPAQAAQVDPATPETNIATSVEPQQPSVEQKVEGKAEPAVEPKTESKIDVDGKVAPSVEGTVDPKLDGKVDPKVDGKVDPKAESKVASKVESKPESKVDPKTEHRAKADPKTAKPITRTAPVKKPKPGRLELQISGGRGTPRIFIDGSASGSAKDLAPGVHTVQITSAGSKPVSFSVTIEDGKVHPKRVALEDIPKPPPPNKNGLMEPGSVDKNR